MIVKTVLPKKATNEIPIATDDEALGQLIKDPTVSQFPQSTTVDSYYMHPVSNMQYNQFNQPMPMVPNSQPVLTAAAETNAASGAEVLVANDNSDWINKKWRPAMGWMYMVVCIFDFIIFPVLWAGVQFWETQAANDAFRQWQPLTLQGAGLFHMAMGAVLGIAAYGRTKEKLEAATKN
jgi:hypothetical protein